MPDDLLVLTAFRASTDGSPKRCSRSKYGGNSIDLSAVAHPELIGNAIVAKKRWLVTKQKMAYAICNVPCDHAFGWTLTAATRADIRKHVLLCITIGSASFGCGDGVGTGHDRHRKIAPLKYFSDDKDGAESAIGASSGQQRSDVIVRWRTFGISIYQWFEEGASNFRRMPGLIITCCDNIHITRGLFSSASSA